jgi:glutaredoxin
MVAPVSLRAEEVAPVAYVFGDNSCELCRTEVKWLFDEGIDYQYLNIDTDADAKSTYEALLKKHNLAAITPLTVVGPEIIVGYEKEQTTGHDITMAIIKAKKSPIKTLADHLRDAPQITPKEAMPCEGLDCDTTNLQVMTLMPVLGLVDLRTVSKFEVTSILGFGTIPRLVSVGWLLVTLGLLVLTMRRKYLAIVGGALMLLEIVWYFYFFNTGYHHIERFVVEGVFAALLHTDVGFLLRQWYVAVYSGVALVDNVLVTAMLYFAFPHLVAFDEEHPGSVGTLALALLFMGGACMAYFVKFG